MHLAAVRILCIASVAAMPCSAVLQEEAEALVATAWSESKIFWRSIGFEKTSRARVSSVVRSSTRSAISGQWPRGGAKGEGSGLGRSGPVRGWSGPRGPQTADQPTTSPRPAQDQPRPAETGPDQPTTPQDRPRPAETGPDQPTPPQKPQTTPEPKTGSDTRNLWGHKETVQAGETRLR